MSSTIISNGERLIEVHDDDILFWCMLVDEMFQSRSLNEWQVSVKNRCEEVLQTSAGYSLCTLFDELIDSPEKVRGFLDLLDEIREVIRRRNFTVPKSFMESFEVPGMLYLAPEQSLLGVLAFCLELEALACGICDRVGVRNSLN